MNYINFKSNVAIRGGNVECLGVKEEPYWDCVEVDNCICPILHNQINLGEYIFHNLLDYGNENIKELSVNENKAWHSLLVIDSSIHGKS